MADARVLIVEDNRDDAALTRRALADIVSASQTVVAERGEHALDYQFALGEFHGRDDRAQPDFILLDLELPGLSGMQVLERIRGDDRTRLIPTVILSGADVQESRIAAYRNGANSFLVKPADAGGFTSLVRRAGHYWLSVNQPVPVIRTRFLR